MRRNTKLIVQGFPGSFHDEAARKYFGKNRIDITPARNFNELGQRLAEDHSLHYGIMAIENSIAGSLLQNYNILRANHFWITGEVYLRISHNLMALPGQSIDDIKVARSHPMALNQCLAFFDEHRHIALVESEDTALTAKEISEQGSQGVAAIGSRLAAELYNLEVVAEEIETSKVNYTRFIIMSRQAQYSTIGNADKASIYLIVSHDKGSLLKVLQTISDHNINISKLQSFPVLGEMSTYYFHLDLEFEHFTQYENCVEELRHVTKALDELGIYKRATIYDHQAIK